MVGVVGDKCKDEPVAHSNLHRGQPHQQLPPILALPTRCYCISLLTGSVLTGVYATAVYIIAFAMEVWLITDTSDILPTPSYVLCVSYFITWTMSVALLVGLALRRTKPILAWLLSIIVLFFPESGLVLFMSLYHWTLNTSFGIAELIFWILRAIINMIGILAVFSLYSQWKDEKAVSRRLRDLTMTSPMANGYYTSTVIKTPLPGSLRAAYHNGAYVNSNTNLRQMQFSGNQHLQQYPLTKYTSGSGYSNHTNRNFNQRPSNLHRSTSSLSQTSYMDYNNHLRDDRKQPGMDFGSMGIAGVGLDDIEMESFDRGYRTQSIAYLNEIDYLNRAPLSRAVSAALLNQYAGPIFDRQSQFYEGNSSTVDGRIAPMRRAHSMNDLRTRNFSATPLDYQLQRSSRQPFSYLPSYSQGNRMSRAELEEFQRITYKDVAL